MLSAARIRSKVRRSKRRVVLVAALLVVTSAVAVHHAVPDGMHMSMGTATVCLAVVAVATVAVSAAIDLLAQPRPSWFIHLRVGASRVHQPVRGIPARAGPRRLEVLRL